MSPRPIAPVGTLEECMGSAVQLPPNSGAGNFIYNGTHISLNPAAENTVALGGLDVFCLASPPISPNAASARIATLTAHLYHLRQSNTSCFTPTALRCTDLHLRPQGS
ncbi:hypothetical protein E2C01_059408 [Portunus trituberculatus]|uniref:Uncharacterized protein n=1 Tax=Portunus trituberculatus TaxID=210409 RepID=A0A5B7H6M5_PORTR|nr:hypothetical protein [Portunus trituberculatus]